MDVTFDMVNAERNFAKAMDVLGALPGLDRRKIILGEAGSILKTCAAKTKVAPLAKMTTAGQLRALKGLGMTRGGPITINAGVRAPYGRVFIQKKNGQGYRRTHEADFQPINQHYTNEQWSKISAAISDAKTMVAKVTEQAQRTRGLARQSWLLIAESLGIDLSTVAGHGLSGAALSEAASARARGGRLYANGLGKEEKDANRYFVTLINRLPYGRRIGLDRTLQSVIAGRFSYIQQSLKKGTFDSLESVAKRFPGWSVK